MNFGSKLQLGAQLNRTRLVTLQGNLPERTSAPVRVGVAEYDPIGDVAALGLETPPPSLAELRHFENADILDGVAESAHVRILRRRVAELQRSGIRPGRLIQVTIRVRVETAVVLRIRQGADACNDIRAFGGVEQ